MEISKTKSDRFLETAAVKRHRNHRVIPSLIDSFSSSHTSDPPVRTSAMGHSHA